MKLYLRGHSDRYAVEQLQMQLFPDEPSEYVEAPSTDADGAVSALSAGRVWMTATAKSTQEHPTMTSSVMQYAAADITYATGRYHHSGLVLGSKTVQTARQLSSMWKTFAWKNG